MDLAVSMVKYVDRDNVDGLYKLAVGGRGTCFGDWHRVQVCGGEGPIDAEQTLWAGNRLPIGRDGRRD